MLYEVITIIANRSFRSRLMVGTGKFSSNTAMVAAMEGSGCEIVTVALRRVDVDNPHDSILAHIDREKYLLLPNTSGARDAEEAVRLARLRITSYNVCYTKLLRIRHPCPRKRNQHPA